MGIWVTLLPPLPPPWPGCSVAGKLCVRPGPAPLPSWITGISRDRSGAECCCSNPLRPCRDNVECQLKRRSFATTCQERIQNSVRALPLQGHEKLSKFQKLQNFGRKFGGLEWSLQGPARDLFIKLTILAKLLGSVHVVVCVLWSTKKGQPEQRKHQNQLIKICRCTSTKISFTFDTRLYRGVESWFTGAVEMSSTAWCFSSWFSVLNETQSMHEFSQQQTHQNTITPRAKSTTSGQ